MIPPREKVLAMIESTLKVFEIIIPYLMILTTQIIDHNKRLTGQHSFLKILALC